MALRSSLSQPLSWTAGIAWCITAKKEHVNFHLHHQPVGFCLPHCQRASTSSSTDTSAKRARKARCLCPCLSCMLGLTHALQAPNFRSSPEEVAPGGIMCTPEPTRPCTLSLVLTQLPSDTAQSQSLFMHHSICCLLIRSSLPFLAIIPSYHPPYSLPRQSDSFLTHPSRALFLLQRLCVLATSFSVRCCNPSSLLSPSLLLQRLCIWTTSQHTELMWSIKSSDEQSIGYQGSTRGQKEHQQA